MYMCSSQSSRGLVDMNGVSQEAKWRVSDLLEIHLQVPVSRRTRTLRTKPESSSRAAQY